MFPVQAKSEFQFLVMLERILVSCPARARNKFLSCQSELCFHGQLERVMVSCPVRASYGFLFQQSELWFIVQLEQVIISCPGRASYGFLSSQSELWFLILVERVVIWVDGKVTVVGYTAVRTVKRHLKMLRDNIQNPICILNFNVYKIDRYIFLYHELRELHLKIIICSNIQFVI